MQHYVIRSPGHACRSPVTNGCSRLCPALPSARCSPAFASLSQATILSISRCSAHCQCCICSSVSSIGSKYAISNAADRCTTGASSAQQDSASLVDVRRCFPVGNLDSKDSKQHSSGVESVRDSSVGRISTRGRRSVLQAGTITAAAAVAAASCIASPAEAATNLTLERGDTSTALQAAAPKLSVAPAVATAASLIDRVELAPGFSVSRVIKGCWQLSGGHKGDKTTDRTSSQRDVLEDFAVFANAGITSFDCADHYGPAERLLGQFRASYPQLADSTQVLTKYCLFSGLDMATISKESVDKAIDVSRARLRTPSVHLMQLYWGDYSVPRYVDAAKYLADAQAAGKVQHLGVTNFDVPRLQAMTDAGVRFVSNQVQYSLLDTRPENGMSAFCAANGIQLLTYGSIGGGFLSNKYLGLSPNDVRLDTYSKGKYASVIQTAGGWPWFQSLLRVLEGFASKHNTSISNIAARWVLQKPAVASVIVGARNASHVREQQQLFRFELDQADQAVISEVLAQGRRPTSDCYTWERGGAW